MALAKSHPYMDQVQGCMAVTGLTLCHLYINYTVSDTVTITMLIYDDYRLTILEPALNMFFSACLAPANLQCGNYNLLIHHFTIYMCSLTH